MAAALHPPRNDSAANSLYPRPLMTDLDFRDNRYPTPAQSRQQIQPNGASTTTSHRSSQKDNQLLSGSTPGPSPSRSPDPARTSKSSTSRQNQPNPDLYNPPSDQSQRTSLSYALPPGSSRRVVERYSLDGNDQKVPPRTSNGTRPTHESQQETVTGRSQPGTPQPSRAITPTPQEQRERERLPPAPPSGPRNSSAPSPINTGPNTSSAGQFSSLMPLSASPTYNPPVAPNYRAYPQQPTYVTPANAFSPMQTVYTPLVPPQEEVCVECAMRDQDMADVDVTSPGVWERASDVLFEELKQRELEDEATGVIVEDSSRPRIKGGRLTEPNLKLWLSINPREPASRQQTLTMYIKSQRSLLEAEALAHARAMQEAKQLDNRMRDAYSQLRRSAYDMGNSSTPADDTGGVRIKPPQSPHSPTNNHAHARSQSREITLLENGMIVEHVDVRKEEKEARERRRREEKRARKSSRSSVMDVTSIISAQSGGQLVESSLKPYSRYSQASSARPTSVLTAPLDRPDLPRAYSQASFSDVHSLGSSSPRRTRFFGMKNLSAGWKSQDSLAPSGMSGSMIDMHVALQRENGYNSLTAPPIDLNTARRSQIWPPSDVDDPNASHMTMEDKTKKKKGGFAKIWRIVTGSGKSEASHRQEAMQRHDGHDDDLPLAPPPPLSYLVERGPGDPHGGGSMRHSSTPSLPSVASPKAGPPPPSMSPPTAPSSLLPSPASLRPYGLETEIVDARIANDGNPEDQEHRLGRDETVGKVQAANMKSLHSVASELDLRLRPSNINNPGSPAYSLSVNNMSRSASLLREKSLPPLPPGETPAQTLPSDLRPRTLFVLPPGSGPAHDFLPPQAPFQVDVRRQSFGGTSSRPSLALQTMPSTKPNGLDARRSFGPRYDEFGTSRRSLGKLEYVLEHPPRSVSPLPSTKRKSKFGFSSLLGKRGKHEQPEPMAYENKHQFPSMGYSPYDVQDDLTSNGYATSTSRHSALSVPNPNLRMSVASRKALEELVQQDPDFLAYRYPSNDQSLDLLR